MKPTQITELISNIKATFVSFFSILMFVALGAGIFAGIMWVAPAMQRSVGEVFDEGSFHSFQIQFPYGLTDDDIAKLKTVEGVSQVEPGWTSFETYGLDGADYTVKLQSMGTAIDTLIVKEGTLPKAANEMALKVSSASSAGLHVGDTITFVHNAQEGSDTDMDLSELENMDLSTMSLDALSGDDAAADGSDSKAAADDGKSSDDAKKADPDGMQYLTNDTFTITALVESPEYVALDSSTYGFSNSPTGSVDAVAWVVPGVFDKSAFQNGYPIVNIRSDQLLGRNTFDGAYKSDSSAIKKRIEELGTTLSAARHDDLHGQAKEKIDKGAKLLADLKKQLDDGEKKVEEGAKELEEGKELLATKTAEGEAKLAEAYNTLLAAEQVKAEGEAKLAEARAKVAAAHELLDPFDEVKGLVQSGKDDAVAYEAKLQKRLDDGEITERQYNKKLDTYCKPLNAEIAAFVGLTGIDIPFVDHEDFDDVVKLVTDGLADVENVEIEYEGEIMTIAEARAKLAEGEEELAAGEAEYNQKVAQLQQGWNDYYAGQQTLETEKAAGEEKLAQAEQELADGRAKLEKGKSIYEEKSALLDDAQKRLKALTDYKWIVFERAGNGGCVEVETFSEVTTNLSFSMAALFIIVGLLVTYSAVSRLVHEQITQIGTKKALGLRGREITTSFLLYSGIAVIAGCIVGYIVGVIAVEGIIGGVLGGRFIMGPFPPYFGIELALIVFALELGLILLATYLACRSILRKQAVELLRGEEPPKAKERFFEKWAIWNKLPLFTQTMINNCLNDKRRVFSTVVGVAGCTALIVTAITLNNDVLVSYDRQYQQYYDFNAIAIADTATGGEQAADKVAKAMEGGCQKEAVLLRKSNAATWGNDRAGVVRLLVPQDTAAFAEVYHINPLEGEVDLTQDGVWMTEAFAEHEGAKVGDTIKITGGDNTTHELRINGFYRFDLTYHEAVMGPDAYKAVFGEDPVFNAVYADTGDIAVDQIKENLGSMRELSSIWDDKLFQHKNFADFSSVSGAVVLIYLALSILMAIVVLLNLNMMFIDEKKRELIVLMINGFSVKQARKYISNDTIVLTVIGIIVGLILGCVMGSVTVAAIEPATASFEKGIDPMAVCIGIFGTAVLSFIMSAIALRRIPRFSLTDINKF